MTKALFLDRDGVINLEKEYLYKVDDFEFVDGIIDLCRYFSQNNYIIIVVTNQSGIAREYYSKNDFLNLTNWMLDKFLSYGISIKKVYFCPHHPDISAECECRKPKPGMLLEAAKKFDIDLKNSIMIGDKERDIMAGINAGIKESYLLDTTQVIKESRATKIVSSLYEILELKC
jgi:D-glycero-D-manno-heptose 1,7-bisphosphate phosphatase